MADGCVAIGLRDARSLLADQRDLAHQVVALVGDQESAVGGHGYRSGPVELRDDGQVVVPAASRDAGRARSTG